ncbi:uncharacterized protein N7483_004670 [Penicillium malachiteum]|uniref:uncharacterized protein n=1 Tax=Penicillium malachiteum TaxID=1324776 RepID=UPI0025487AD5|nr:uncharacterized protein N7483_004670 [Penicillium malachiteum]KAJ5730162.1 hypothetical protein N7483_004670 [Penicillium malachiteum]
MKQSLLIKSTFAKYISVKAECRIFEILVQLRGVIRRDIVQRDVVRDIFETGWKFFRQRSQEEPLIPFGRALAWSYVLHNRQPDAVNLLDLIQKGDPPFRQSIEISSQTLIQPVRELYEKLVSGKNGVDRQYISSDPDYPLVEIKRKINRKSRASALHLNDTEQGTFSNAGILFRKNSIVMRKRRPYLLGASSTPRQPYVQTQFFAPGSVSERNEILAHRPLSHNRDRLLAAYSIQFGPMWEELD